MFDEMVRKVIVQVVSSWQVWLVVIVLVIYISIIKSVANLTSRRPKAPLPKVKKKKAEPLPVAGKKDDLGLGDDVVIEEE